MDDVEKQEKQQLDDYIKSLEETIRVLNQSLDTVSREKEQLFEDYISSLYKIYKIGRR